MSLSPLFSGYVVRGLFNRDALRQHTEGDDGILPAAVFLSECAHLGSMQALMV